MMIQWLEEHMMSCYYVEHFGVHCPGCGFQRSLILLLKGEVWESIKMFPPLLPTLFLVTFLIIHLIKKYERGGTILKRSFILVVLLMVVNFFMKF